jgi:hypothetical protein
LVCKQRIFILLSVVALAAWGFYNPLVVHHSGIRFQRAVKGVTQRPDSVNLIPAFAETVNTLPHRVRPRFGFFRCDSLVDPRFPKYPRLPVSMQRLPAQGQLKPSPSQAS